MAGKFVLPELGEGVEQGDIVSISVSAGDVVEPGQSVVELETDKATVDVPFEEGGKITEVMVSVGDTVEIGAPLFSYESADGGDEAESEGNGDQEKEKKEKPETSESKGTGDGSGEESPDQASEEEDSEPETEDSDETVDDSESEPSKGDAEEDDAEPEESREGIIPAGPAARRVAREKGVDLAKVKGSGKRGRITVEDVESFAADSSKESSPAVSAAPVKMPDFTKFGEIEKEPFSNVRRATAKHLSLSWNTAPHVTQHDLVDVTSLESWRQRNLRAVEKAGGKLTVTAVIVKVVAEALKRFPKFNASIDMGQEEVILKKYVNIGIAVDTPRGLLVPVMRDVDRKSITDIAVEIGEISERARKGKTGLDELAGGCFTVTNLGGIGGHFFTPIINHPEVAILGVSRSRIEPVYRDGEFVPAEILPLSLSYDHRLIDGADAARFVKWISDVLENPMSMLL